LPVEIRELADKNYELLKANPRHRSLKLKRIEELWSVRVGQSCRAVGIDALDGIQWIWGDRLIYSFRIHKRSLRLLGSHIFRMKMNYLEVWVLCEVSQTTK